MLSIGEWQFDPDQGVLKAENKEVHLTPRSASVLHYLLVQPGKVVPQSELLDEFWQGSFSSDNAVAKAIAEIRKALGSPSKEFIKTIPKRGYMLEVPQNNQARTKTPGQTGTQKRHSDESTGHFARTKNLYALALVFSLLTSFLAFIAFNGGEIEKGPLSIEKSSIEKRLAVLPLTNMSNTEGEGFFTAGVHEDLISSMAQISGLRVTSKTSVLALGKSLMTVPEIAERLDVNLILEGSVRREGNTVRIVIQLIDATSDQHLWTRTYDRELKEIFKLQSEIAENVANELQLVLEPEAQVRIGMPPTLRPTAYDYFLRGVESKNAYDVEGNEIALMQFKRAVEIDPEFGLAISGVAKSLMDQSALGGADNWEEVRSEVEVLSLRGLQLAPDASFTNMVRAQVLFRQQNATSEVLELLFRAHDLDTTNEEAVTMLAVTLVETGRLDEGMALLERELEINDLSAMLHIDYAVILMLRDLPEAAVVHAIRAIELDNQMRQAYVTAAFAYTFLGNYVEAVKTLYWLTEFDSETYFAPAELSDLLVSIGAFDAANSFLVQAESRFLNSDRLFQARFDYMISLPGLESQMIENYLEHWRDAIPDSTALVLSGARLHMRLAAEVVDSDLVQARRENQIALQLLLGTLGANIGEIDLQHFGFGGTITYTLPDITRLAVVLKRLGEHKQSFNLVSKFQGQCRAPMADCQLYEGIFLALSNRSADATKVFADNSSSDFNEVWKLEEYDMLQDRFGVYGELASNPMFHQSVDHYKARNAQAIRQLRTELPTLMSN